MPVGRANPSRSFLAVVAALALTALSACSDANLVGGPIVDQKLRQMSLDAYKVGIGDKLKLGVFGEKDLSGVYDINSDGTIALPLVGPIRVAGDDKETIRRKIMASLSNGFLRAPKVTVDVDTYRPIYVHGEVRSGGAFPFKVGTRLRDAIAIAGGYTYRANKTYVALTRDGYPRESRVEMPSSLLLMPGDNIRVPERYF